MITRRALMKRSGGLLLAGAAFAGYSIVVEPNFMLDVTPYRVSPANWPADLNLRIAVISDLHACEPWMPPSRIARIADVANALEPDLIVLLGDFSGGVPFASRVMPEQWAEALSRLRAPLGVFAVLGNHDWWHGALSQDPGDGGESVRRALRHMGAVLLENETCCGYRRMARRSGSRALPTRWPSAPAPAIGAALTICRGRSPKLPTTLRRSCWRMSRSSFRARQSASR
jgi:predicted MPP superfamily phosphohydrolase